MYVCLWAFSVCELHFIGNVNNAHKGFTYLQHALSINGTWYVFNVGVIDNQGSNSLQKVMVACDFFLSRDVSACMNKYRRKEGSLDHAKND